MTEKKKINWMSGCRLLLVGLLCFSGVMQAEARPKQPKHNNRPRVSMRHRNPPRVKYTKPPRPPKVHRVKYHKPPRPKKYRWYKDSRLWSDVALGLSTVVVPALVTPPQPVVIRSAPLQEVYYYNQNGNVIRLYE